MTSSKLIPEDRDKPDAPSAEVEFALVLSRMIDSVKNDPGDLRQAIYDLARYKLQEQFTHSDAKEIKRTQLALETAINGVESFSRQLDALPPPTLPPQLAGPAPTGPHELASPDIQRAPARPRPRPMGAVISDIYSIGQNRGSLPYVQRAIIVFVVVVGALIAFQQRHAIQSLVQTASRQTNGAAGDTTASPQPATPPVAAVPSSPVPIPIPTPPTPLLPTNYGVYALSDDKLYELRLIAGRAPDMRVAVSAPIKTPSELTLPNGHPKFVVFRRDIATNFVDQADVRVMAKVTRDFSVGTDGKKPGDRDDTWIIRNIAFPFRSSPMKESPEMYELHRDDTAPDLSPGRYVLVIKAQTYEFTVAGDVVDPRQCLERIGATNGTFYAECRKP